MEAKNKPANSPLQLVRLLDAPLELVWEMWTNGKQLAGWWGPQHFTNPAYVWEAVPGKKLLLNMQGPDGKIYPMDGEFIEVIKPRLLSFLSGPVDEKGNRLFTVLTTVNLKGVDGKTEISIVAEVSGITENAGQYLSGMNEGWKQSIDKLENYTGTQNKELVFERLLDAPQQTVFEAFTDPLHLANWWGPNGFSITTHEFNATAGGTWRFIMHGPDGTDYPNKILFTEVTPGERIRYKHAGDADTENVSFEVTVNFEKRGDRTRLTMHMQFGSAEALKNVSRIYGAVEGAHQTLGRLQNLLAANQKNTAGVSMEILSQRIFNAPVNVLYNAWTDPAILARWWGPNGFNNTIHEYDLQPGGKWLLTMHGPDGKDYPNAVMFIHIQPNKLLVWEHTSDPNFYVAVNFEDLGAQSKVSFRMIFSSPEACAAKKVFVVDANEENFDRLEEVLKN